MRRTDVNTLTDINLTAKKVFMRVDFNVPLHDGRIRDDSRIRATLETIRHVLRSAKVLVLASHLGRPAAEFDPSFSLEPVAVALSELLQTDVSFLKEYATENVASLVSQMPESKLILLENLRFYAGEKKNDALFAKKLARGFDVYLNDAFATMHRSHASVVGIAEHFSAQSRGIGFLVAEELGTYERLLSNPVQPFLFIVGGAKVADKIGVILNMLKFCQQIIIGGRMAFSFLKYKGHDVSETDPRMDLVASIFSTAAERRVEIVLPCDHIGATSFSPDAVPRYVNNPSLPAGVLGLDIGEKTRTLFCEKIARARTILWNAPVGVWEWEQFSAGTRAVAEACRANTGTVIAGGGDTGAALKAFNCVDGFSHISTGGGASLKFLAGDPLLGLQALRRPK